MNEEVKPKTKKTISQKKTNQSKTNSKKSTTKSSSNKNKSLKSTSVKKVSTPKKNTPSKKEVKKVDIPQKENEKIDNTSKRKEIKKLKNTKKQEVLESKEEIVSLKKVNPTIKNEKLVILIISLIITLLLFSTIYIINSTKKEKARIANYSKGNYQVSANLTNTTSNPVTYSNIKEVTYEELNSLISKNQKIIMLVSNKDCPSCKTYQPVLNKVLKEKNLIVYKIETSSLNNENKKQFANEYSLKYTPTTIIFENKEEKIRSEMGMSEAALTTWIDNNY